jgi:hypothetical protein
VHACGIPRIAGTNPLYPIPIPTGSQGAVCIAVCGRSSGWGWDRARLVGQGLRSGIGRGFRVGVGGAHGVAQAARGDHAAGAEDVAEDLVRELRRWA